MLNLDRFPLVCGLGESGEDWDVLLVDSGSALHACPVKFAPDYKLHESAKVAATTASGHLVPHRGQKHLRFEFADGSSG